MGHPKVSSAMTPQSTSAISGAVSKIRTWHFLILIITLTILSYSNTLNSPLVLDDRHSFIDTSAVYISELSLESVSKVLHSSFGVSRLIPELTFAINHMMAGGKATYYHATNIIIHLLCFAALCLFLKQLLSLEIASRSLNTFSATFFIIVVCGLWVLSPVQTNAVTYLVQRMTSLCALFYFSTLAFYLHGRQTPGRTRKLFDFTGATFCLLLAALSKQNAATLPLAILMTEVMFISPDLPLRILKKVPWQAWLFFALLVMVLLPLVNQPFNKIILNPYNGRHFTLGERLLTEGRVVIWYITLLMLPLPSRMNLDHDIIVSHSLFNPITTLFSLTTLLLILLFAWHKRLNNPLFSFGVFWFFLTLLIESTIVPLELVFEHRLYLPSAGLFVALIAITDEIISSKKLLTRNALLQDVIVLATLIIFAVSSLLTTARNNDWRDELSISRDGADKSPNKPRALANYGVALSRAERYEEAIPIFEKTIAYGRPFYESYFTAAGNIIAALASQGKYTEARKRGAEYFQKAPPKTDPQALPSFLYNLSYVYYSLGEYKLAMEAIKTSLGLVDKNETEGTIALATSILLMSYDSPEGRKALGMSDSDGKEISVIQKVTELLLNNRDYQGTAEMINTLKKVKPDAPRIQELSNRLKAEQSANSLAEAASNIENHPPYKNDITYRLCLSTTKFILEFYYPLQPFVGKILDLARDDHYRTDPFIALYDIKWQLASGTAPAIDITHLEEAINNNPDFTPLLELSQNLYLQLNMRKEALATSKHLLKLYPGHRDWNFLEKNIINLEREITSQESSGATIKH